MPVAQSVSLHILTYPFLLLSPESECPHAQSLFLRHNKSLHIPSISVSSWSVSISQSCSFLVMTISTIPVPSSQVPLAWWLSFRILTSHSFLHLQTVCTLAVIVSPGSEKPPPLR